MVCLQGTDYFFKICQVNQGHKHAFSANCIVILIGVNELDLFFFSSSLLVIVTKTVPGHALYIGINSYIS